MKHSSSDNSPTFYEVLRERTKRPFVFVLVCLAAALALVMLQKEKTNLDKIQNAPFYLVPKEFEAGHKDQMEKSKDGKPNSYSDQMKYVRIGYSNKLTDKAVNEASFKSLEVVQAIKEEFTEKSNLTDVHRLLLKNVSNLNHQYFVNEEEIIRTFNEAAKKDKEAKLKSEETKINNKIDENAASVKNFLDTSLKKTTEIKVLESEYEKAKTKNLKDPYGFWKQILDDGNLKPLNHSDITAGGKLDNKIKEIAENTKKDNLEKKLRLINSEYDYISGELFKTLKNKDEVKNIFNFSDPNPVSKSLMDNKTGLVIVYYLAEITLKVIIVFGLLYVILIPLKHIFFITTSTDTLVDQSKKVFDKGAAATAASGLGRAILVTVTTITIGAATLAGALPNSEAKDKQDALNSQQSRNLTDPRKTPEANPPGTNPLDPEALKELAGKISTLNDTVDNLKKEIETAGLRSIPDDVKAIKTSLSGIESIVGKRENPTDIETLIGKLNDVSETLKGDSENSIQKRLDSVQSQFKPATAGRPETVYDQIRTVRNNVGEFRKEEFTGNNVKTDPPQNLTEALSGVWSALGTRQYLDKAAHNGQSQNQPNQSTRAKNILQTMEEVDGKIGSFDQLTEKTITDQFNKFRTELEQVKKDLTAVSTNIGNPNDQTSTNSIFGYNKQIAAKTTQMGRFMIGESGGFKSLFGQLLMGEKYYITPMLIEDLKTQLIDQQNTAVNPAVVSSYNDNLNKLIKALEDEISNNKGRKTIVSARFLQEILKNTGFSEEKRSSLINHIREFSLIY